MAVPESRLIQILHHLVAAAGDANGSWGRSRRVNFALGRCLIYVRLTLKMVDAIINQPYVPSRDTLRCRCTGRHATGASTFSKRIMAACYSLIPAAGVGSRMAAQLPKQYLQVAGKPLLRHVLDTFAATPAVTHTFVVVSPEDGMIDALMVQAPELDSAASILRVGGASRRESVRNGLEAIRFHVQDDDWILVHDAARPGLTVSLVEQLIAELEDDDVGGLLALPVVDTLKLCSPHGRSSATVARTGLWAAQTPQMFRYALLWQALGLSGDFTDEASAIEALGLQPKLVMGSARNFKLTLPADVALAELYLRST